MLRSLAVEHMLLFRYTKEN